MSNDSLQQISAAWAADGYRTVNASQVNSSLRALESLGDLIAPRARLADIGCGAGEVAAAMSGRGLSVLAVDGAASMVEASRALCAGTEVRVEQQDANRLDLHGEEFDIVHSSWVLHWLHDLEHAVNTMCGAVAPGGALVLQWSRSLPLAEGTGLVGIFQDLAAAERWREHLSATPILSYQHPAETVAGLVRAAGLEITQLDTQLWPNVKDAVEPTQEIVDAVVNSLWHTGFGRQYDTLGPDALQEFLEEGVRRAIALKTTDPRDARLLATRPSA